MKHTDEAMTLGGLNIDLRAARVGADLTQAELAEKAGVARATVIQIESGNGRLPTVVACASALGLTPALEGQEVSSGATFGAALSELRQKRGLTVAQAAALAKVRPQSIEAIEADNDHVPVVTAEKLAEALGSRLRLSAAA